MKQNIDCSLVDSYDEQDRLIRSLVSSGYQITSADFMQVLKYKRVRLFDHIINTAPNVITSAHLSEAIEMANPYFVRSMVDAGCQITSENLAHANRVNQEFIAFYVPATYFDREKEVLITNSRIISSAKYPRYKAPHSLFFKLPDEMNRKILLLTSDHYDAEKIVDKYYCRTVKNSSKNCILS